MAKKTKTMPPIHPGETLREDFLKPLGLTASRLAIELQTPVTRVRPAGGEQSAVFAGHADRERTVLVEQTDDLPLHLPDEDHPDDVHRLRSRHPKAAGKDLLDAKAVKMRVDLWPATMDDDDADPGVAQEDDIFRESVTQGLVRHRMAAVLHDHCASVEPLEPRKCFDERSRLGMGIGETVHDE